MLTPEQALQDLFILCGRVALEPDRARLRTFVEDSVKGVDDQHWQAPADLVDALVKLSDDDRAQVLEALRVLYRSAGGSSGIRAFVEIPNDVSKLDLAALGPLHTLQIDTEGPRPSRFTIVTANTPQSVSCDPSMVCCHYVANDSVGTVVDHKKLSSVLYPEYGPPQISPPQVDKKSILLAARTSEAEALTGRYDDPALAQDLGKKLNEMAMTCIAGTELRISQPESCQPFALAPLDASARSESLNYRSSHPKRGRGITRFSMNGGPLPPSFGRAMAGLQDLRSATVNVDMRSAVVDFRGTPIESLKLSGTTAGLVVWVPERCKVDIDELVSCGPQKIGFKSDVKVVRDPPEMPAVPENKRSSFADKFKDPSEADEQAWRAMLKQALAWQPSPGQWGMESALPASGEDDLPPLQKLLNTCLQNSGPWHNGHAYTHSSALSRTEPAPMTPEQRSCIEKALTSQFVEIAPGTGAARATLRLDRLHRKSPRFLEDEFNPRIGKALESFIKAQFNTLLIAAVIPPLPERIQQTVIDAMPHLEFLHLGLAPDCRRIDLSSDVFDKCPTGTKLYDAPAGIQVVHNDAALVIGGDSLAGVRIDPKDNPSCTYAIVIAQTPLAQKISIVKPSEHVEEVMNSTHVGPLSEPFGEISWYPHPAEQVSMLLTSHWQSQHSVESSAAGAPEGKFFGTASGSSKDERIGSPEGVKTGRNDGKSTSSSRKDGHKRKAPPVVSADRVPASRQRRDGRFITDPVALQSMAGRDIQLYAGSSRTAIDAEVVGCAVDGVEVLLRVSTRHVDLTKMPGWVVTSESSDGRRTCELRSTVARIAAVQIARR